MNNKKYTIREFFESKSKLFIHTPTEEDAIKLLNAFDEAGYSWGSGASYNEKSLWLTFKEKTVYDNRFTFNALGYSESKRYKILTMKDIIFEDDKENPKETEGYNVKIEVKKEDGRYNLYINDAEICYWSKSERLRTDACTFLCSIIDQPYTKHSELQDHLIENHLVTEPIEMTIREIEEKLGIDNLVIVEDKDE